METFSAVRFHRNGGPEVLQFDELPLPEPGPDEVRFKVHAFALNRADLMFIHGDHYTLPAFPSRIGSEASGVVDRVGDRVTTFKPGDRVTAIPFYTQRHGVQGEYAVVPEEYLTPWPPGLSEVEACSVWMQYLTPYFALVEEGRLTPEDHVLVTAASSSAGIGTVQLVKMLGAQVITTTRTPDKKAFLNELGADAVIVTDEQDVAGEILRVTSGRGVRLVFDPIGGTSVQRYVEALAPHAIIFAYGSLSDEDPVAPLAPMVRKAAVLHPYSMFNHVNQPAQRSRGIEVITRGIAGGRLRPIIDRCFPYHEALQAYTYMESNQQKGKIVVQVS